MTSWMAVTSAAAAAMWLGLLLLPWRPWGTRERLEARHDAAASRAGAGGAGPGAAEAGGGDPAAPVTAVVPARNEAAHIAGTLAGLQAQRPAPRIIVVDDQSTDGTAAFARAVSGVEVVAGEPLPPGWTGKLWALQQGLERADTPLVLLLDADIRLQPGVLAAMLERRREGDLALVSLMAALRMQGFWERLLMPAFIYFFKLLYPFALANGPRRGFHAAAGGCMLVRRDALADAGGVAALRDAVIDDCTLARNLKRAGYRTWTGLTRDVVSTRACPRLRDTWRMVARTAYTQLGCSVPALLLCTALLALAFLAPLAALIAGPAGARLSAAAALLFMTASYLPVVCYYGLPAAVALTLPLSAVLFLGMTWTSAWNHWRGVRARWKDREYARVVTRQEP